MKKDKVNKAVELLNNVQEALKLAEIADDPKVRQIIYQMNVLAQDIKRDSDMSMAVLNAAIDDLKKLTRTSQSTGVNDVKPVLQGLINCVRFRQPPNMAALERLRNLQIQLDKL